MYLVAGGYNDGLIASTEILTEGDDKWIFVGSLPRAMSGIRAVSIDKNILVTGKN